MTLLGICPIYFANYVQSDIFPYKYRNTANNKIGS